MTVADVIPWIITNHLATLRVLGFVASASGFTNQPEILDGASRLFAEVLGELGQHSRAAFSVEQLPLNASVELVVTFMTQPHIPVRGS